MSFEIFLELIKYSWLPILGIAYKEYKASQEKQDSRIERLENKISHQMTKDDVIEVVDNAIKLLSANMETKFEKLNNGIHQIKNQHASKDAILLELTHTLNDVGQALQRLKEDNEKK